MQRNLPKGNSFVGNTNTKVRCLSIQMKETPASSQLPYQTLHKLESWERDSELCLLQTRVIPLQTPLQLEAAG